MGRDGGGDVGVKVFGAPQVGEVGLVGAAIHRDDRVVDGQMDDGQVARGDGRRGAVAPNRFEGVFVPLQNAIGRRVPCRATLSWFGCPGSRASQTRQC